MRSPCRPPGERFSVTWSKEHSLSQYPLFLRTRELKNILGISETRALELLREHGIKPVDLGRGRGNGLRWRTTSVIQLADTLHAEAQAISRQIGRKAMPGPIRGKSAADLYAEFNREHTLQ